MNCRTLDHLDIHWLSDNGNSPSNVPLAQNVRSSRMAYPYPPEMATGWVERIPVAKEIVLFNAQHRFNSEVLGNYAPKSDWQFEFSEPTLWIRCVHKGIHTIHDLEAHRQYTLSPGQDLFTYSGHGHYTVTPDVHADVHASALALGESGLRRMLGDALADCMLKQLRLAKEGPTQQHPMPQAITHPLHRIFDSGASGDLRAVHAQSKVLEYILNLAKTAGAPGKYQDGLVRRDILMAVREYLFQLEGSIPTLDALAERFGVSPQLLNRSFQAEFGNTIYAAVNEHRLQQAYAVLRAGTTPIKTLAYRLGYSHPNHFTFAFKRRFGRTPGSVRCLPDVSNPSD